MVPSPPASLRTTAPDIAPLFPSEAMLVCATCKPKSLRAQSRPRTDDGKLARFHVWRHQRGVFDGQMIEFGPTRRSGQSRAVRKLGPKRHEHQGPRGANLLRFTRIPNASQNSASLSNSHCARPTDRAMSVRSSRRGRIAGGARAWHPFHLRSLKHRWPQMAYKLRWPPVRDSAIQKPSAESRHSLPQP